jgi:hypothetical protein
MFATTLSEWRRFPCQKLDTSTHGEFWEWHYITDVRTMVPVMLRYPVYLHVGTTKYRMQPVDQEMSRSTAIPQEEGKRKSQSRLNVWIFTTASSVV